MRLSYTIRSLLVSLPATAALAAAPLSAQAANASARLTIVQEMGEQDLGWAMDLTPLLTTDAQGNARLDLAAAAAGTTGTVTGSDAGNWVLNQSNGQPVSLTWHSTTTANGGDASTWSSTNLWATSVTFTQIVAIGDPELYYAVAIRNNSNATQTYTFGVGETMDTPIVGAYNLYADLAGSITNSVANPNAVLTPVGATVQKVMLGNGGIANVDAGAGVGTAQSRSGAAGTSTWGPQSTQTTGTGSYDYWELESKVTLTARNAASFTGYAQITPVPEPTREAMLLAGVALIAFLARRHTRKG